MKNSLTAFSKIVIALALTGNAISASIGSVKSISGDAFLTFENKTLLLKQGDQIPLGGEVITEEGSQLSLMDFHDRVFHLSGGAHFKMGRNTSELKSGYLWVQSFQEFKDHFIKTANSKLSFRDGEAVLSYDTISGRTQAMVINGNFDLSNLMEDYMKLALSSGQFSFIDMNYENGSPRRPTQIGFTSYKKVTSLFSGVKPFTEQFQQKKEVARAIASVEESAPKTSESKVMFIRSKIDKIDPIEGGPFAIEKEISERIAERRPASVVTEVRKAPAIKNNSNMKVRIIGMPSASKVEAPAARAPASQKPAAPSSLIRQLNRKPASVQRVNTFNKFEESVKGQYDKKTRHPKEVNSLIDELKNFKQDYQQNY